MPRLSAEHPRLEDAEGLDDDRSLVVFVVDADEYEPPTHHSFKDIKRRAIGRPLTELPPTCGLGVFHLVFHEAVTSRVERAPSSAGWTSCGAPSATPRRRTTRGRRGEAPFS
jgi:hypothetical protein